jgi:hypothetical protein
MNFILIQKYSKCHQIENNKILFTRKNKIIVTNYNYNEIYSQKVNFEKSFSNVLFSVSDFFSKILRKEIFNLSIFNNKYLFSYNGNIYLNNSKKHEAFTEFNGSRPLRILNDSPNKRVLFGEYFNNKDRVSVKIFCKNFESKWKSIYTFKPGSIRHIHNVIYDSYVNKYIVLTGDTDLESKILSFDPNFKNFEIISQGSQFSRSIDIIPTKYGYIIPTDTPKQKNYIYFQDRKKNIKSKTSVNGSIFHLCQYDNIFLASTALEPSNVNNQAFVYLYGSLDGLNWIELFKIKKKYPLFMSRLFRYPEIELTKNIDKSFNSIPFYFRNLKGFVDGTYFLSKKEIIQKINDGFKFF